MWLHSCPNLCGETPHTSIVYSVHLVKNFSIRSSKPKLFTVECFTIAYLGTVKLSFDGGDICLCEEMSLKREMTQEICCRVNGIWSRYDEEPLELDTNCQ